MATESSIREIIELQAEVCYHNVDRTLASWTRTALSLIVFGTVVDRFGLLMVRAQPTHLGSLLAPNPASSVGGIILIALGVVIALGGALRHQLYRRVWVREYGHAGWHGPWLAFAFAAGSGIAGIALIVVLTVFSG